MKNHASHFKSLINSLISGLRCRVPTNSQKVSSSVFLKFWPQESYLQETHFSNCLSQLVTFLVRLIYPFTMLSKPENISLPENTTRYFFWNQMQISSMAHPHGSQESRSSAIIQETYSIMTTILYTELTVING